MHNCSDMRLDDCLERENSMERSWEKEGKGSELVCSQGGERKRLRKRKREEGKEGRETQTEKNIARGGGDWSGKGKGERSALNWKLSSCMEFRYTHIHACSSALPGGQLGWLHQGSCHGAIYYSYFCPRIILSSVFTLPDYYMYSNKRLIFDLIGFII